MMMMSEDNNDIESKKNSSNILVAGEPQPQPQSCVVDSTDTTTTTGPATTTGNATEIARSGTQTTDLDTNGTTSRRDYSITVDDSSQSPNQHPGMLLNDNIHHTNGTINSNSHSNTNTRDNQQNNNKNNETDDHHSLLIGRTRVCDSAGYRGTVMYVGPVASSLSSSSSKVSVAVAAVATSSNGDDAAPDNITSNIKTKKTNQKQHTTATRTTTTNTKIYVGVVWDDWTRGKHNGTIIDPTTNQLRQYFKVPKSYATSSSSSSSSSSRSSRSSSSSSSSYYSSTTPASTTTTSTTATCSSFVPLHKICHGMALTKELILSKYVPLSSKEFIALPYSNILPDCTVQCATTTTTTRTSSSRFRFDDKNKNNSYNNNTTTRYKPIQLIGEYNIRQYQQVAVENNNNTNNSNTNTNSNNHPNAVVLHSISLRSYQLSSIDVGNLLQWTTPSLTSSHGTDTHRSYNSNETYQTSTSPQQDNIYVTHSIHDIDLAGNLFGGSWQSVHDTIQVFPNLVKLSFASNHLHDWTSAITTTTTATLVSNRVLVDATLYPCHSLQHLNVNGTHIQHISTIVQIGTSFPNLQELILANNRYVDDASSSNYNDSSDYRNVLQIATKLAVVFPKLQLLDCSNCYLQFWGSLDVDDNNGVVPQRNDEEEDDECYKNNKTGVTTDHDDSRCNVYSSSSSSNNNNNDLNNLFVLLWSKLPKLQNFSLDDNPSITKLIYPYPTRNDIHTKSGWAEQSHEDKDDGNESYDTTQRTYFPSLQQLQFVHTGITEWMDIVPVWDEHIPTLQTVRFKHCPLVYGMSVSNVRHQLIGHCPNFKMINATTITDQERREVAKHVIGSGISMTNDSTHNGSDFDEPYDTTRRHRRYDYWVSQYPEIARSITEQSIRDSSPTSTVGMVGQSSSYYTTNFAVVNATFRSMASSSCTQEPFIRRLPTQMTIRKVKALCARQFGTDIDHQILYFRHTTASNDDTSIPEIMDCNDHTLHYYGVPDGAEILMHEIDDHRNNRRPAMNSDSEGMYATADQRRDHQTREINERVDRLEKEMYDFKLRQQRITKK